MAPASSNPTLMVLTDSSFRNVDALLSRFLRKGGLRESRYAHPAIAAILVNALLTVTFFYARILRPAVH
jgi:hypothetical protein